MEIEDQTFQLKNIPVLSQLMTTHSVTLLIQMTSPLKTAMLSDQSRGSIHFFLKDTYFPTRSREVTRSRGHKYSLYTIKTDHSYTISNPDFSCVNENQTKLEYAGSN
jgi:hypothetical protein